MKTKEQIVAALKFLNPAKIEIFKTKKENDFSLTQHGYMLLTASKLYSNTFIANLDKDECQTPGTLISLKKIFDNSPYYLKGRTVFHFDEIVHAEVCLHGSMGAYIKHLKAVESFNR